MTEPALNTRPPDARNGPIARLVAGEERFDVIVIGGGITGAGIAREAAGSGFGTLLVEQRDFAWGTSSRSSKMVHGGLRYLGSGQWRLARESVRERQRLMAEAPGLIEPMQFVMPHFHRQFPGPWLFQRLLWLYDLLAGTHHRRRLSPGEANLWAPGLNTQQLTGASVFTDAVTDDARLVLRALDEARTDGAICLNYVPAVSLRYDQDRVTGVVLRDAGPDGGTDQHFAVDAGLVVNATGAWADHLRDTSTGPERIRPLRGSHLVLPFETLPVTCAVSLFHPKDRRPVFAFPWQGRTVLGTTDLDHPEPLDHEPAITAPEVDYLLAIAATLFPGRPVSREAVIACWAGVRPVVSRGTRRAPSRENREHCLWRSPGLISVAGGKLTTFRHIAREVLEKGAPYLPGRPLRRDDQPFFRAATRIPARPTGIGHDLWRRLQGFYGNNLNAVLDSGPTQTIADTGVLWAELCWAAQGDVIHLDDLMFRRTRLGLTLPHGGSQLLPAIEHHCRTRLGWSLDRWRWETDRYLQIWTHANALPAETTP